MNPDRIGKFILELRTEKNLSQYQLADMIPISRQAISKWERGQTTPDSSTLIRLSAIFGVSINELLNGERLNNNSIEDLEATTLSIVDESNKKSEKIRKNLVIFTIIVIILLLAFLSYYFINSYNTIKVYTTGAVNDKFIIHDGVFITAKQKTYLKLGKIIPKNDSQITINQVTVYYKKDNEKKVIFENETSDITIIDLYGYEEYFPEKDIKDIVTNTYMEIAYNNTEKELIHLTFKREFVNNFLYFLKSPNVETEKVNSYESFEIDKSIIELVKTKGINQNEYYVLDVYKEMEKIRFYYYEEDKKLLMSKNDKIIWIVLVGNKQQFICPIDSRIKETVNNDNMECYRLIKNDIEKYLK